MVNPKKNLLMGLEVTEGSQKKGQKWTRQLGLLPLLWWPERAAWEKPFLVMAAEETWSRSQWCSRLGPQQRALSCCRNRQGRASIPTLLSALLQHLVPGSSTQDRFSESFPTPWACVEEHNHHRSVHVFRKRSKTGTAKAGNSFLLYCRDSGRGPDWLEKLGFPSLQISTDYLVSSKKPKKQQIKSTS